MRTDSLPIQIESVTNRLYILDPEGHAHYVGNFKAGDLCTGIEWDMALSHLAKLLGFDTRTVVLPEGTILPFRRL